jgi:pyruvate/2-oxoglutarate/acetoin dehydrogenase E1 component
MSYFDELKKSMDWLGAQPNTLFLGQAVGVSGTFMYNTIKDVPSEKRRELPVCESFQMQMTLGLSLAGYTPISIFPRLNFLTLALGDLINMVDKIPDISKGKAPTSMIIRTAVGPDTPIHPGHQHVGDFTEAFKKLFKNIEVIRFDKEEQIFPAYKAAYENKKKSYLLIEVGNLIG